MKVSTVMKSSQLTFGLACFMACGMLAGCGGGGNAPTLATTTGKVTYNGNPVKGATVLFQPEKGPMGTGMTDSSGNFTITTGGRAGAPIGKNKVTVSKASETQQPGKPMSPEDMRKMQMESGGKTVVAKPEVPEKYGKPETSPLEAQVESDGAKNVFEFPLVD